MKTVIIFLAVLGVSQLSLGQGIETAKLPANVQKPVVPTARYVPRAAFLTSSLSGSDSQGFGERAAYEVGVTAELGGPRLALETGLLFRRLSASYEGSSAGDGSLKTVGTADLSYLSLPLLVRLNLMKRAVYVNAGLLVSAKLAQSRMKATSNGRTAPVSEDQAGYQDRIANPFELSSRAGIGTTLISNKRFKILAELNFSRGFTPIFQGQDIYSSAYGVSLGAEL